MTVYPEQPGSEAKLVLEAIHDLAAATEGDPFARQKLVEGWDQERLRRARVMVVGAGALGNEVLKNLALLGIGSIFIVDFDRIAISNLSRSVLFRESDSGRSKAEVAAERTKTLCLEPTATVCYFSGNLVHDLGTGVYRRIDVVIGCLDNLEARMSISRNCWLVGSPWVDGGMHGWDGRISIFCPGQTACYLCTLGEVGLRDIRRRYSCDQRRHRLIAENKMPAIQSTSAIVAAIQVQEALRLLSGDFSMVGKTIAYNGWRNHMSVATMTPTRDHDEHQGSYHPDEIVQLEYASADMPIGEFLHSVAMHMSGADPVLELDSEFIINALCQKCEQSVEVLRPLFTIYSDEYTVCPNCGFVETIDSEDIRARGIVLRGKREISPKEGELLNLPLNAVGIPPLHIVPVRDEGTGEYGYFELTGDVTRVLPGWISLTGVANH